jgi:hypothetical protein
MARVSLILVAILLASWSLLVLTQKSFDHEFGVTFTALLVQYDKLTGWLVEPLAWIVRDIAKLLREWWGWRFDLHPYWKHILVVLTLYMSNYISNNVRGRSRNAIFLAFFLPPLAIFGAGGLDLVFSCCDRRHNVVLSAGRPIKLDDPSVLRESNREAFSCIRRANNGYGACGSKRGAAK